jgi:uncharacterized protein (TIGR03437 family)
MLRPSQHAGLRTHIGRVTLILFLTMGGFAYSAQVSLPSLSAAPGSSIPLPLAFSSTSSVSGLQFDIEFNSSVMNIAVTPGDAVRGSGKNVYTAELSQNVKRFLIVGLNQNALSNGVLLNVFVNLNPNAPLGVYSLHFSNTVATSPNATGLPLASLDGTVTVQQAGNSTVRLQPTGVLNAASLLAGPFAPGEIVTLLGSGIGPISGQFPSGSPTSTDLAGYQMLFDGKSAPILFAASNQINAVVPFSLAGKTSALLEVSYLGHSLAELTLPVVAAAPAIFTVDSSGVGQGAILNQDSSANSASNPALRGSIVTLFATGAGQTNPASIDGQIAGTVLAKPQLPVSVQIGGLAAEIQYGGAAPGLIAGIIQVNAVVPAEAPAGFAVPVVLTVGGSSSPLGVTVAIK